MTINIYYWKNGQWVSWSDVGALSRDAVHQSSFHFSCPKTYLFVRLYWTPKGGLNMYLNSIKKIVAWRVARGEVIRLSLQKKKEDSPHIGRNHNLKYIIYHLTRSTIWDWFNSVIIYLQFSNFILNLAGFHVWSCSKKTVLPLSNEHKRCSPSGYDLDRAEWTGY
jgi:hypothetical protein